MIPRPATLAGLLAIGAALTGAVPAHAADGNFTVTCRYSHSAPDDPIVSPGQPGAAHLHDFFGAMALNAYSDFASMRAHPTSCQREADHSGYWTPALLGPDGRQHPPTLTRTYYTASTRRTSTVRPFPPGFRMIARDPNKRNPFVAPDTRLFRWRCAGGNLVRGPTRPFCDSGTLDLTVVFPECWDGRPDSPDHSSHVAYAQLTTGRTGDCPASHPTLLPRITMFIGYPTPGGRRFELASGGQFSAHADFLNAWDEQEQALLVEQCLNAGRTCFSGGPAGAPSAKTARSERRARTASARR
ncbi:MAG TPA: DUF1996 domain-containing protein [Thermoleophilaceae bacterium]|nr:DUF1996 domain-containing protein [Thermoleophilaceae bacterium]